MLYKLWGVLMCIFFPIQILMLTVHMQLYKLSMIYNSFCLDETERAWKWSNEQRPETEVWTHIFKVSKSVFLWAIYYAVTPAKMIWMGPPLLVSFIMADKLQDLPKTGSFIALAIFWFLKFPLDTPIQWV